MICPEDDEDLIVSQIRHLKNCRWSIDLIVEELCRVGFTPQVAQDVVERAYYPPN